MTSHNVETAREAARRASGEFGEQPRHDPGSDVLADIPLPGRPIAHLDEPDRYEAVIRTLAEYDEQRVLDTFEVETVEEAVVAGRRQLAEAGAPGSPDGYVYFGEELDMVTATNPYPVVCCEDIWPAAPERLDGEELDVRQVGVPLGFPPRTWKVTDGRFLTITPRFYTIAELVTTDDDGVERVESVYGDEAVGWEKKLAANPGGNQRLRFRPVQELRVDVHEHPDVAEWATDTYFDWTESALTKGNSMTAAADLWEFASRFEWSEVSSARWAQEVVR